MFVYDNHVLYRFQQAEINRSVEIDCYELLFTFCS